MVRAALFLIPVLASACAAPTATTTATAIGPGGEARQIVLRACDDGGDGGVLIDGVCL